MTRTGAQDLAAVVHRARALDKAAVATLISIFEDERPGARERRTAVQEALDRAPYPQRPCTVVGFTGTPGSGKSSLIDCVTAALLAEDPAVSIAVLAVDPSSPISGGALLGDRTRIRHAGESPRLFFRSQASACALGGLAPTTYQVCRVLSRLFDALILETVGIGQSEADVRELADHVVLVIAPLGGDDVQLLKAGVIEMPDAFVVNKCDEPAADRTYHQLRANLWLARPLDGDALPVHRTSARTGEGARELAQALLARMRDGAHQSVEARSPFFFARWVRDEWGRVGVTFLDQCLGGAAAHLTAVGGFDRAQAEFGPLVRQWLVAGSNGDGHAG